jgi:hypothetical protein
MKITVELTKEDYLKNPTHAWDNKVSELEREIGVRILPYKLSLSKEVFNSVCGLIFNNFEKINIYEHKGYIRYELG